jgi:ubiquinol-cytochrome c reductase cytochrome b subunit
MFAICFIVLGKLGADHADWMNKMLSRLFGFGYFAFFGFLWLYSGNEKTKPVPERIA